MWLPSAAEIRDANVKVCARHNDLIGFDKRGQRILDEILAEAKASGEDPVVVATILLRRIAQDQPFTDGNKRTAFAVAEALAKAGIDLRISEEELMRFLPNLKDGYVNPNDLQAWLISHIEKQ